MKGRGDPFLAAVESIYEAALEEERWETALERLCGLLKSDAGSLSQIDMQVPRFNSARYHNLDPATFEPYNEYYLSVSPYRSLMEDFPDGIRGTPDVITDEALGRTEFYNDWQKPQNFFYDVALTFLRDGSRYFMLNFKRAKAAGYFDSSELNLLGRVAPHVQRALAINRRIAALTDERETATGLLERLGMGVILIDEEERPMYLNSAAEAIVRVGEDLRQSAQGLAANLPRETEALRKLIHEAVLTGKGLAAFAGGTLALTRPNRDQPLAVLVSPLRSERTEFEFTNRHACAVVFVSEPEALRGPPPSVLQVLYGLTPAEARLVGELANGRKLQDIADSLQITKTTARNQLSAAFLKTGTHRQSELIRLMLSNPAATFRL